MRRKMRRERVMGRREGRRIEWMRGSLMGEGRHEKGTSQSLSSG